MPDNGNGLLLDVLSADQFTKPHIDLITNRADQFSRLSEKATARAELRKRALVVDLMKILPEELTTILSSEIVEMTADKLLDAEYRRLGSVASYLWFDEPSTRTLGSFEVASATLGMALLGHRNAAQSSSMTKGETFKDTMRTVDAHLKNLGGGVVIMRTSTEGQPAIAADILDFPVINAGDGQNEHPTQALLDIYTIKKRLGRLDNLNVVMGGDPRYSRTVHSLTQLLSLNENVSIKYVGDKELWLDAQTKRVLRDKGIEFHHTTDMNSLTKADVVYWTRFQKERLADREQSEVDEIAERYKTRFSITDELVHSMQDHAILMHPLPRGPEIPESVDSDHRAAYWDQVEYSVPVRTALLEFVLRNYYIKRVVEG
jgi:aspartate carbamoyltransferase catalytic subunit